MLGILIGTAGACSILVLGQTIFAKTAAGFPLILSGCVLLMSIVLFAVINELIDSFFNNMTLVPKYEEEIKERIEFSEGENK